MREYPLKAKFITLKREEKGMTKKVNYILFPALIIAICIATANMHANACGEEMIIEILSPTNKIYAQNTIPLTFTINKPTCWIRYSLDGQANVTITGNTTLSDLSDGEHSIIVYAKDKYDGIGASNTVNFAVDTTPPNITDITQSPSADNVTPEDEVIINATVTDEVSGVRQVILYYYAYPNDNETWISVDMTNVEGNIWTATIPAFPEDTNVTYVIMAEDNVYNRITTAEQGYVCRYQVVPEFAPLLMPTLFILATITTVAIYRKKRTPTK
jgi:hypothetical protein